MNVERLHLIANTLHHEFEETSLVEKFETMVEALQTLVNQSHPQYQQNLAESLNELYSSLTDTESDQFSPTWQQILAEIGGADLVGVKLKTQIEGILQRNQITLAVAVDQLKLLLKRVKGFSDSLSGLVNSLEYLKVGQEQLAPGECEIGVMIPRAAIHNNLERFTSELKEIAFILHTMSEIATGKKDGLEVKTISSSDLTIYLKLAPAVAACVAHTVEKIIGIYKQLLEIKKLNNELKKQGVPQERTAGVEEYANTVMKEGIEKISVEIINRYDKLKGDKGRKNELHNGLRISLNKIANRIDKGFHIEIRCEPLEAANAESKEGKETLSHLAVVQKATPQLQLFKFDGEPILQLPEGGPKVKQEKTS